MRRNAYERNSDDDDETALPVVETDRDESASEPTAFASNEAVPADSGDSPATTESDTNEAAAGGPIADDDPPLDVSEIAGMAPGNSLTGGIGLPVTEEDAAVTATVPSIRPMSQIVLPTDQQSDVTDEVQTPSAEEPALTTALEANAPGGRIFEDSVSDATLRKARNESPDDVATVEIQSKDIGLRPVPTAADRDAAKLLFQEAFGAEYAAAKTGQERLALATKLYGKRFEVEADLPSYYVLLDIVRQIGVQTGDVNLAIQSVEDMESRFDLARQNLLAETLRGLSKTATDSAGQSRLVKASEAAAERFYYAEQFEPCVEVLTLGIAASRKANENSRFQRLNWMRKQAEYAVQAKKRADQAFEALSVSPHDSRSNEALGRYLCFVRRDWQNGLPILSKGTDPTLTGLANAESESLTTADEQTALGDQWWNASERAELVERDAMRSRAAFWYQRAVGQLPPGFARLKAEKRLAEALAGGKVEE